MGKLKDLVDERASLVKQARTILDTANKENRGLTKEEEDKTQEIEKKLDETEGQIRAEEEAIAAREAREAKFKSVEDKLAKPTKEAVKAEIIREHNFDKDGNYRGFTSLGEQLQAIARSSSPGRDLDTRLKEMRGSSGAGGANEQQGSEGGFAVQSDFVSDLMQRTYDASPVASRCTRTPISAASNKLSRLILDETSRVDGSRWGGVRAYWRDEAATVTATKPKLAVQELDLKSLMALYIATDEMLQDAPALQADVNRLVPAELAFKVEDGIIRGTGVGQFLGVLNAAATVSVAKEGSQTADTIVYNNVIGINERLWVGSDLKAEWFINQFVENQLMNIYKTGSMSDVFPYMPAGGISGKPYSILFGRRVNKIEHASALGDLGDIILADFSQYEIIEKGGVKNDVSIHVYFLYGESTFRFMLRINGHPLWHSALTPYKGSSTVSPFVTLAERA